MNLALLRSPFVLAQTCAALALALLACGSSETQPQGSGGASTTSASTTQSEASTSTTAAGHCDNASDEAARLQGYCPDNRNIQDISGQCGLDCIQDEDAQTCVTECIVLGTQQALSHNCASCVALTVVCGRDYCLNDCIADTQSELCLRCRCGQNKKGHSCYDEYEKCAGRHLTDCDDLEAGTWTGYPHPDAHCSGAGGAGGSGAGGS
jgi:hypothetical protein